MSAMGTVCERVTMETQCKRSHGKFQNVAVGTLRVNSVTMRKFSVIVTMDTLRSEI